MGRADTGRVRTGRLPGPVHRQPRVRNAPLGHGVLLHGRGPAPPPGRRLRRGPAHRPRAGIRDVQALPHPVDQPGPMARLEAADVHGGSRRSHAPADGRLRPGLGTGRRQQRAPLGRPGQLRGHRDRPRRLRPARRRRRRPRRSADPPHPRGHGRDRRGRGPGPADPRRPPLGLPAGDDHHRPGRRGVHRPHHARARPAHGTRPDQRLRGTLARLVLLQRTRPRHRRQLPPQEPIASQYLDYHPGSHFWPTQLIETGIVLALAALALFAAFRVLRARHP